MNLSELRPSETVRLVSVGGERSFRRRLMELGFVPGTEVSLLNVAPLGDPLEFKVRNSHLSIRRREAQAIVVAR